MFPWRWARRVCRRSATYDRARSPHIETSPSAREAFEDIPVRFLGRKIRFLPAFWTCIATWIAWWNSWKWMENWWTNNNRCPRETLIRGKFIAGCVWRPRLFVHRPNEKPAKRVPLRYTNLMEKIRCKWNRSIWHIGFKRWHDKYYSNWIILIIFLILFHGNRRMHRSRKLIEEYAFLFLQMFLLRRCNIIQELNTEKKITEN